MKTYIFRKGSLADRVDYVCSRALLGTTIGVSKHALGHAQIAMARLRSNRTAIADYREDVSHFRRHGYVFPEISGMAALVGSIYGKYCRLIEDDNHTYVQKDQERILNRHLLNPEDTFPEISQLITKEVRLILEEYYRSYFHIMLVRCWRNYSLPRDIIQSGKEVFSYRWHYDNTPPSVLKLFVNLSDVEDEDGPFHLQSIRRSRKIVRLGYRNRRRYNLPDSVIDSPQHVVKATGTRGSSIFCNTELCLHRAGLPASGRYRDIAQFKFVPAGTPLPQDWIKHVKTPDFEI